MERLTKKGIQAKREFCACGSITEQKCVYLHNDYSSYDPESTSYGIQVFKILNCSACCSISVILYEAIADSYDDARWEYQGEDPHYDYRRLVLHGCSTKKHPAIPIPILEVFNQAEAVLAHSSRATFILCRAVLEEVCNDFKISKEDTNKKGKYYLSLRARLVELFKGENLPEDLQTIIKGIKDLGNEGAHAEHLFFGKKVNTQDAESLCILVNYVLQRLYVEKYDQAQAEQTLESLRQRVLEPQVSLDTSDSQTSSIDEFSQQAQQ